VAARGMIEISATVHRLYDLLGDFPPALSGPLLPRSEPRCCSP
jgi:hypothetical protein